MTHKLTDAQARVLPSGYWHIRWNENLWFQWPVGREPVLEDGFGWVDEEHLAAAQQIIDGPAGREAPAEWVSNTNKTL